MKGRSYLRPVEVGFPYLLVVLALIFSGLAIPGFVSLGHLSSMSMTAAYLGIIAIGQTLVLLLGGIDLSVPYMLNFVAVLLVQFQSSHVSGGVDVAVGLAVALGAGLLNGLGIALLNISPLVMTLGMNSVLQGAALIYSNGSPLGTPPNFVAKLATGTGGIPYVDILWIVLIVIVTLVLVFTRFGRSIYAIGSNRRASELSGLPVKRTILAAYALSGLAAGLGGILLVGYSGQAYLGMGDNYLLPSIAVVVIGGTSILGGRGSYLQTVAGTLVITIIVSAVVTVHISQAGQDILYGGIILVMAFLHQVAISSSGRGTRALTERVKPLAVWLRPVQPPDEGSVERTG